VDAAAQASGEGSGRLIEGWYTRSRRDSVIAIVKLAPPEVRDLSARETAERFRELVGDIPDADEIEVNYTLNDNGADVTYLLRHRDGDMLQAASPGSCSTRFAATRACSMCATASAAKSRNCCCT
jgi:hypothetical protein